LLLAGIVDEVELQLKNSYVLLMMGEGVARNM
jgi:hypothetical protein